MLAVATNIKKIEELCIAEDEGLLIQIRARDDGKPFKLSQAKLTREDAPKKFVDFEVDGISYKSDLGNVPNTHTYTFCTIGKLD